VDNGFGSSTKSDGSARSSTRASSGSSAASSTDSRFKSLEALQNAAFAIRQGLMERRVREVLFSSRFADEVPDALEAIVTSAFEQSALCALARGPAEEQLDRTGNGVGALLRYAVAVNEAGPTTTSLGSDGGPGALSG